MSTVIDWKITQLACRPQTAEGADYVVVAYWLCEGTNGEYKAQTFGNCVFPVVQGPSFTPYADLTQDQVLSWCWANGVNKATNEAIVEDKIQEQINPPVVTPPLPWSA